MWNSGLTVLAKKICLIWLKTSCLHHRSFVRPAQFLKRVSRKRTFDKIKILKKNNFLISSENDLNAFMWLCSKTFDVEIFNVGGDSNCNASRISFRYEKKNMNNLFFNLKSGKQYGKILFEQLS
jgi:hypothetical protein